MPLGEKTLRPTDVVTAPDGTCSRPVTRYTSEGTPYPLNVGCCERCWEPVPSYATAPAGYVSPDSARKFRAATIEGRAGLEAVPKIVCYECYKQDALEMFGVFDDFPHELR
jgi:hypothetical protein